ncbi:hypothetical protein pv_314 [Pithovirus sibericum]|uniref:Uncharacterized protein n=1 Tax=Pithovirus sibericum TaxID=1450746 RepID=W5S580_9VIRU|nr:hypothetical protein pv_314 [Pithovirus sibericum]AHH01881.1 hypothetical protein pv_314 [Pithovirus sibericum]
MSNKGDGSSVDDYQPLTQWGKDLIDSYPSLDFEQQFPIQLKKPELVMIKSEELRSLLSRIVIVPFEGHHCEDEE